MVSAFHFPGKLQGSEEANHSWILKNEEKPKEIFKNDQNWAEIVWNDFLIGEKF